jgi:nicotinate dehydrogenase subunit B
MTRIASAQISRRAFLSAGSLVVTFSLVPRALAQLAGGGEGG